MGDVAAAARELVAGATAGTLATLTADGAPWASWVTYGLLPEGSPVLLLSTLAEHGRNLQADGRASLVVVGPGEDPLDRPRVTLAGVATAPPDPDAARAAHLAAVPSAARYADFGDFALWVLRVERVRWVGGFGRMGSCDGAEYAAA